MLTSAQDAATRIQRRWRAKRIVGSGCWTGRAATVRTNLSAEGTFSAFWTHVLGGFCPSGARPRVRFLTLGFHPDFERSRDRGHPGARGLDTHGDGGAGLEARLVER